MGHLLPSCTLQHLPYRDPHAKGTGQPLHSEGLQPLLLQHTTLTAVDGGAEDLLRLDLCACEASLEAIRCERNPEWGFRLTALEPPTIPLSNEALLRMPSPSEKTPRGAPGPK